MNKLAFALSLACLFAPVSTHAQNAYITNQVDNTVSVIDTATNTVVGSPILVGEFPYGVAVTPDGSKVYVTNEGSNTVSVIATATNTVVGSPIPVGASPNGVAVTPDGSKVYVTVGFCISGPSCCFPPTACTGSVQVIDTATNTVVGSPILVGSIPLGVAVTPDGSKVYVTVGFCVLSACTGGVQVIDTATNTVVGSPILVARIPLGVAVTPDSTKVYVADRGSNTVSVIDTATNTVVGPPIPVGKFPAAFGMFIQPPPIAFSAFTAKLTISSFQPKFTLASHFTLGQSSGGINPSSQAVTLKIGTFTVTIPPFTMTGPGNYSFLGVINGLLVKASIIQTGAKTYTFDATANVNLSKTKNLGCGPDN
jgi:YVTN family beta-propeller protein